MNTSSYLGAALLHGCGALQTALPARPARSRGAPLDLSHRVVSVLWANGQDLGSSACSRGSALLRHGFAEWAGAVKTQWLPPKRRAVTPEAWTAQAAAWLASTADSGAMPVAVFADVETALQAFIATPWDGATAWLAFGSPPAQPLLEGEVQHPAGFPALPLNVARVVAAGAGRVWLGAPRRRAGALEGLLPVGTRIDIDEIARLGIDEALRRVEVQLLRSSPGRVWCLVFLDGLALAPGPSEPEVGMLASTLRWMQRLVVGGGVMLISSAHASESEGWGEVARTLGQALFRYPDEPKCGALAPLPTVPGPAARSAGDAAQHPDATLPARCGGP